MHTIYTCEFTVEEENENTRFIAYTKERDGADAPRKEINAMKFIQNTVRSLLAEKKAIHREFELGDWVLRR